MLAVPSNEKVAGAALNDTASAAPCRRQTAPAVSARRRRAATLSPRQIPVADSVALLFIAAQFAWPVRLLRISTSLPPTDATMRPSLNSTVPKMSAGSLSRSGFAGSALTTPRAVSMERVMRPPVGTAGRNKPSARALNPDRRPHQPRRRKHHVAAQGRHGGKVDFDPFGLDRPAARRCRSIATASHRSGSRGMSARPRCAASRRWRPGNRSRHSFPRRCGRARYGSRRSAAGRQRPAR